MPRTHALLLDLDDPPNEVAQGKVTNPRPPKATKNPTRRVAYAELLKHTDRLQARLNELEGRSKTVHELRAEVDKLQLLLTREKLHSDALQAQLHAQLTGGRR